MDKLIRKEEIGMDKFNVFLEVVEKNELIARKFHEVELKILKILNFKDFFEVLLSEVSEKFGVPYLWLSIVKGSEVEDIISSLKSSDMLKEKINRIDIKSFNTLLGTSKSPVLMNHNLKPFFKLLPQNEKYFIKSIAFVPITLDEKYIGSFNLADSDIKRFEPGIDTSLLERLALKISLCLSNVTAHEKLKYMAYRDALTGLLNRRVMEKILKREFFRANRYEIPLSVVFIDLDYFKQVNDRYGHDFGDELLKYVSNKLSEMSRETDIVARFAGDEFVVILPETDAENANRIMQRIQTFFKDNPLQKDEVLVPVSISFGISSTETKAFQTPEQLLKNADEKLYIRKKELREKIHPNTMETKVDNKTGDDKPS